MLQCGRLLFHTTFARLSCSVFCSCKLLKEDEQKPVFCQKPAFCLVYSAKKMGKNLSSGFTAIKISQVRYRTQSDPQIVSFFCKSREIAKIGHENTPKRVLRVHWLTNCSIATCQSLFTDQPFSRQGCLKAHSDEC